jgi:STE24 endopeptidase
MTNNLNDENNEREISAKRYSEIKQKLSIQKSILSFLIIFLLFITGLSRELEKFSLKHFENIYIAFIIFVACIAVIEGVITFPLSFYSGFILEHKYKLSNQTLFAYIKEDLKGLAVGIVLGLPVLIIFYYILKNYPGSWWFIFGIFLFFFSVLLARIAPVIIFPLFYKFKPVENESLNNKIISLCNKTGVKVEGIFTFDMSKDTKKANAAFTGLGKSKRIILGDTLLQNFSEDEIESIFAHELGHYKMKHVLKLMILSTIMSFTGLYVVSFIYSRTLSVFNIGDVYTLSVLPLLILYLSVFYSLISPLSNYISRKFEWQADNYALQTCTDSFSFMSALEKLSQQNLSDKYPKKWVEFLFHSHPSLGKRIEYAKNFKKQ